MGKLLNLQQGVYLGKKEKSFHASWFSCDPIRPMDAASFTSVKHEIEAEEQRGIALEPLPSKGWSIWPELSFSTEYLLPSPRNLMIYRPQPLQRTKLWHPGQIRAPPSTSSKGEGSNISVGSTSTMGGTCLCGQAGAEQRRRQRKGTSVA